MQNNKQQGQHQQPVIQFDQQRHSQVQYKLMNMLSSFFTDNNVRQLFVEQLLKIPSNHYCLSIKTNTKLYLEINNHPSSPILNFQPPIGKQKKYKGQGDQFYPNRNKNQDFDDSEQISVHAKHQQFQAHQTKTSKSKNDLISQGSLKKIKNIFTIRITKEFPIGGVRLYAIDGDTQPHIFDTRDLIKDCLGQKWSFRSSLYDIYSNLYKIDEKLEMRTEKYLSIQKSGQFQILDQFQMKQFNFFSSLNIFPNISKQAKIFSAVGVTETHLLVFKQNVYQKKPQYNYGNFNKKMSFELSLEKQEIQRKNPSFQYDISKLDTKIPAKYLQKKVFLSRFCDLQCISQIKYCAEKNQIILTILKYKSIKSFNEFQPLTKKYVFEDPQYFLRTVLKHISKFQPIKINLTPKQFLNQKNGKKQQNSFNVNDPQEYLLNRISETQALQDRLYSSQKSVKQLNEKEKKTTIQRLHKSYQKLIQYYSARAMPYYLIYVNKLNNLYSKYSNIGQ